MLAQEGGRGWQRGLQQVEPGGRPVLHTQPAFCLQMGARGSSGVEGVTRRHCEMMVKTAGEVPPHVLNTAISAVFP